MTKDINFTTAEGGEVQQHSQTRKLTETVMYPTHVQRGAESPEFEANKKAEEASGEGCYICGITQEELGETIRLEGHHYYVEWALANSTDLAKIQALFPDATSVEEFLDSKENLLLLCPKHHRSNLYGVHEITMPNWVTQKMQQAGWDLVTGPTTSGTDTLRIDQVATKDWYPEH
jgi:hypothetical protein